MEDNEYIGYVKRGKHKRGQAYLLKHLSGDRLTQRQAILAKCYECNGMGESAVCDIKHCPLQQYTQWDKQYKAR